jgi:two-component system response regulator YesN
MGYVARAVGEMLNAENTAYKLMLALNYISNNYHKDISRDDIANQIHLNPTYFSHLFKAQMGQSFIEYLRQIRIDRAKHLLEFTNDYQIHIKVGYNSSKYFAKVFRQQTGYTPSEYRKMVSNCAAVCAQ